MSSSYVRTEIKNFLTANAPTENQVDLSGRYEELTDMLDDFSIGRNEPWLGIQFVPSIEETVSLNAGNTEGKYREIGLIFLHIVERSKPTVTDDILARAETLQSLLRGQRINDILIEGVSPANFEAGGTLQFDGGYQSAGITVNYQRDLSL